MKARVLTSILIVAIAIPTFVLSGYIVYPIVLSLLALMAIFELLRVLGAEKNLAVAIPSYLMALALPIAAYFATADLTAYLLVAAVVVYVFLLYVFMLSVFSKPF